MKNIPFDPTRVRILAAGNATPATNRDGTPRVNRDRKPLYNLPVLVLAEGSRAEATSIRLPGPVAPLPERRQVSFVDGTTGLRSCAMILASRPRG